MTKGEPRQAGGWRLTLSVWLGVCAIYLLARTWRTRMVNAEPGLARRRRGEPVVFTLPHGHLLPLMWHHRREGVALLISEHRDGELIARISHAYGYRLVRGSTSRGAGRALIALVKALKDGHDVAITPDGPRGPAGYFAPGALVAAQRAGAYILPVAVAASRAWRFSSWDRFMIPKPFARLTVAYGIPTPVEGDSPRDVEAQAPHFQRLIEEAEERANA